jgi:hypothetical protein
VNITPIDKTTDLVPALPITQVPTWDGAVWVGGIDLAELGGVSAYRLRDSGGSAHGARWP